MAGCASNQMVTSAEPRLNNKLQLTVSIILSTLLYLKYSPSIALERFVFFFQHFSPKMTRSDMKELEEAANFTRSIAQREICYLYTSPKKFGDI